MSLRRSTLFVTLLSVSLWTLVQDGHGGCPRFRGGGAVGGISITPDGVVAGPQEESLRWLRTELPKRFEAVPGELKMPVERRMISLRQLEAAVEQALRVQRGHIPDELRYLGGLQRVQYILVYPEQNDIVLAGPGEGWKLDDHGTAVGVTTGRPVVMLDDLLVAFRTAKAARDGGITCSIDPTAEGRRGFEAFMKRQKTFNPSVLEGIAKSLGMQQITLTGVPTDSHFARVLVACDYRMKRIAMNLDKSPLKELPGFLDLLQTRQARLDNMMPRWWLATHYEPLGRSPDGLAWEIRGQGVKAMTEDDLVQADGTVKSTGERNPVAQKWAELMTAHYDQLAQKDPVFGELRNLMDLCVTAAVIQREGLLAKAGLSLPMLADTDSDLAIEKWQTPKTVATQCSFVKRGKDYIITASGGVEIDSWQVASRTAVSEAAGEVRRRVIPSGESWRWN